MCQLRALCFLLLMSLSCTTFAHVYQSTDSEGVPTFGDEAIPGSHEIEIEETNVADPFVVNPDQGLNSNLQPQPKQQSPAPEINVEVIGEDDDNYIDDERLREKLRGKLREHHENHPGNAVTLPAKPHRKENKSGGHSQR